MSNCKTDGSLVHVAVAAIVKDGRVLISKRAQNVHQGGLWEFPGGKVEKGETVTEALGREIEEELGVEIHNTRPLIKLIHHYSDKSVVLETLLVTKFSGKNYQLDLENDEQEQLGLEGQVVKWIRLEELDDYQFPEANEAIIEALMLPDCYLITPDCDNTDQFIDEFINSIQGHSLVQLRIKSLLENRALIIERNQLMQQVCEVSKKNNVQLLMNSFMLLDNEEFNIIKLFAGIHLTSSDLHDSFKDDSIKRYRKQYPEKKLAASCHSMRDIERANDLKLDFIVVSAVKATASHPEQRALGWELFKALTDVAKMPVFALGGMEKSDIRLAQNNGAQGISAISSLWNMGELYIVSDEV